MPCTRTLTIVFFLLFLLVSCRREKLDKTNEALLIGNWYDPLLSKKTVLIIDENGTITFTDTNGVEVLQCVLAKVKEPENETYKLPLEKHYFSIKFRKKLKGGKLGDVRKFTHLLYTNGEFDAAGNFNHQPKLLFSEGENYGLESVFVKN